MAAKGRGEAEHLPELQESVLEREGSAQGGQEAGMTPEHIREELEKQQQIQMSNPPESKARKDASAEIHRLAELPTGTKPQDARSGDDSPAISRYEAAALNAISAGRTLGDMLRLLPTNTPEDELQRYAVAYAALRQRNAAAPPY